jgi:hypothetical protein
MWLAKNQTCGKYTFAAPWYYLEIMAKLRSAPLYPVNLSVGGIPANLCKNKTPEGRFQIARVLKPGGPQEGEFEVLWEGDSESGAEEFARIEAEKAFPGLLTR